MRTNEKRRAPRSPHDSVLEFFDPAGKRIAAVGRLVDFSTVGVCFASTRSFAVGDLIRARLRLLKEGRLTIHGHVVWVRKKANTTLYGVAFDSVRHHPQDTHSS